jgi:hypothetical protein
MRKFKVYNTFDQKSSQIHDFDVTIEDTDKGDKYTLYRSNGGDWVDDCKGEELFSLLDTGNGVIFPKNIYSKEVHYCEMAELFVLLSVINKIEDVPIYGGRVEEVIESVNFNI